MNVDQQKQQLRLSIAQRMASFPEKERTVESRTICKRIEQHLSVEPQTMAVYYPMKSEVDILPLLQKLLDGGWSLFMPRAEGKTFEFRQVRSLNELVPGPFGIREPTAESPLLNPADLAYVLVPGVAFDYQCNRLGRGNGGYDKWLASVRTTNPSMRAWGVALERQMVNAVPVLPHDQRMDAVITARMTHAPGQGAGA